MGASGMSDSVQSFETFRSLACDRISTEAPAECDLPVFLASFGLVVASSRLTADYEASVHRGLGLTWSGFRTVFCLWVVGPLPASSLARMLFTSASTVSSVVGTLERSGLVSRERLASDRRVVTVALTPKGRRLAAKAFAHQHRREADWLQSVPRKDLEVFVRVLDRLAAQPTPPPPSRARAGRVDRTRTGE